MVADKDDRPRAEMRPVSDDPELARLRSESLRLRRATADSNERANELAKRIGAMRQRHKQFTDALPPFGHPPSNGRIGEHRRRGRTSWSL